MVAHADDLRLFYAADLQRTEQVSVTAAGTTSTVEALPKGRYLVQILSATGRIFIARRPFAAAPAMSITAAPPNFPMDMTGVQMFEINVVTGVNDQLGAIGAVGVTAELFVTKISRD
jgi:hypothetical protein